jgi:hypothetical protein
MGSLPEEVRSDVSEYIRGKVAAGFGSSDEIAQAAVEVFGDEAEAADLEVFAAAEVRAAIEDQLRAEMEWPAMTDCDRLDAAFHELESRGVVARQDFSCCGTCGAAEIADEMETLPSARGYAFFHMQDTEGAVGGTGLYLSYGSIDEEEKPALDIAHEIVAMLRKHGLNASWDGSWSKRIFVPLDWKRRYRK